MTRLIFPPDERLLSIKGPLAYVSADERTRIENLGCGQFKKEITALEKEIARAQINEPLWAALSNELTKPMTWVALASALGYGRSGPLRTRLRWIGLDLLAEVDAEIKKQKAAAKALRASQPKPKRAYAKRPNKSKR